MTGSKRLFVCYPDGNLCTIPYLEKHIGFKFLDQIAFENDSQKEEIKKRGLLKLEKNDVRKQSIEFGKQFQHLIEQSYIPDVSIRWINDAVGYGLFAEETVKIGSYFGEYSGVIRKNDRRDYKSINNYCYEYPVLDETGKCYVIDATSGHLTRFINHSFTPNLKPEFAFIDGFFHLIFIAISNICKNSQLSYNYGYSYWYARGSPNKLS